MYETDKALHAGNRGPTLLEDFHNREKISHFDHERIPERAVHARGAGAFGEFKLHTPLTGITTAKVSHLHHYREALTYSLDVKTTH